MCSSGSSVFGNFNYNFYSQSLSGFVPSTGTYSTFSSNSGPFYGTNSVSQWKNDFSRIQVLPITSYNSNQGKVEVSYCPVAPNLTVGVSGTNPSIPQATLC
jgi:hypothetical protein